jgi:hypothetical protein
VTSPRGQFVDLRERAARGGPQVNQHEERKRERARDAEAAALGGGDLSKRNIRNQFRAYDSHSQSAVICSSFWDFVSLFDDEA